MTAASQAAGAVLAGVVEACQRQGIARGIEPSALTLMGWSTAHGLASLVVDGPLSHTQPRQPRSHGELSAAVAQALGALLRGKPLG